MRRMISHKAIMVVFLVLLAGFVVGLSITRLLVG